MAAKDPPECIGVRRSREHARHSTRQGRWRSIGPTLPEGVCNANWEWMGAALAHDRRVGAALGDVEIIQDGGIRSRWRQAVGLVTRP
jgi:hypothetical protein